MYVPEGVAAGHPWRDLPCWWTSAGRQRFPSSPTVRGSARIPEEAGPIRAHRGRRSGLDSWRRSSRRVSSTRTDPSPTGGRCRRYTDRRGPREPLQLPMERSLRISFTKLQCPVILSNRSRLVNNSPRAAGGSFSTGGSRISRSGKKSAGFPFQDARAGLPCRRSERTSVGFLTLLRNIIAAMM